MYASFLTFRVDDNVPSQTTAALVSELSSSIAVGGATGDEIPSLVVCLPEATGETRVLFRLISPGGVEAEIAQRFLTGKLPFAIQISDLFESGIPEGATVRISADDQQKITGTFFVFDKEGRPSTARAFNVGGGQ